MRNSLPSTAELLSFDAMVRFETISAAAEHLCVTSGGISRHLWGLERKLKARLFEKVGRRLVVSELGQSYHAHVAAALHELYLAQEQVSLSTCALTQQKVRLRAPPTLAARWLMPRLTSIEFKLEECEVVLLPWHGSKESNGDDYDIAFLYVLDTPPKSATGVVPQSCLIPVWSPHIACPLLPSPRNGGAKALRYSAHLDVWDQWTRLQPQPLGLEHLQQGMVFEHASLMIEAACAGRGVGLVPQCLVRAELRSKKLVTDPSLPVRNLGYYKAVLGATSKISRDLLTDGVDLICRSDSQESL